MGTRVLITSAGSASGMNVIKSLKKQTELPVYLVSIDSDPYAAGLKFTDASYVVPRFTDPDFLNELLRIVQSENIRFLIPTFSSEIEYFSEHRAQIEASGAQMLLPSSEAIRTCNHKVKFAAFAQEQGLVVPKVFSREEALGFKESSDFPVFVKPIVGSSSVGTQIIRTEEELRLALTQRKDLMVQEYIRGQEVTVDVFTNKNGDALAICPRVRISVKNGQSVKGKTIGSAPFEKVVKSVCKKLKLQGASNFQFLIRSEIPFLIEVNPRFAGGGLMLTTESGVNLPLLVLKELLGKSISPGECFSKPGFVMSRYWEEVFWSESL